MSREMVKKELDYSDKPHILYFGIFKGNDELFCKIGVTGNSVETRFKNKSNYEIIDYIEFNFSDGISARGFESILLERVLDRGDKYYPVLEFGGKTECYKVDKYGVLCKTLREMKSHPIYLKYVHEEITTKSILEINSNTLGFLGLDFQCRLIYEIINDFIFRLDIMDLMSVDYFDDDRFKKIFLVIKDLYDKEDGISNFYFEDVKDGINKINKEPMLKNFTLKMFDEIMKITDTKDTYVVNTVINFCLRKYKGKPLSFNHYNSEYKLDDGVKKLECLDKSSLKLRELEVNKIVETILVQDKVNKIVEANIRRKKNIDKLLSNNVDVIPLHKYGITALHGSDIITIRNLVSLSESDILQIKGIGSSSMRLINRYLYENKLNYEMFTENTKQHEMAI